MYKFFPNFLVKDLDLWIPVQKYNDFGYFGGLEYYMIGDW